VAVNLAGILEWSARLAGCDAVPADSQVYVEAPSDVRRVLFGVDIEIGELLFARDAGYDAVIAHHPAGDRARMDFERVVHRQVEQMTAEGIPAEVAEAAVEERLGPMRRAHHMANLDRVVGTARLIGLPFCNIHLACDLIGRQAIVDMLRRHDGAGRPVAEVLGWFDEFPEMEAAMTRPEQWVGDPQAPLGRWTVAMAGGTNGGYPVFREYWRHGVDTIFAMHCAEEDVRRLRAEAEPGRSLVVTGHMATDSIGINRVIAGLEAQGVEVTRTSGIVAP
jgi:putative NIF3 family GTP cyclohydrolase 1 type 2